MRPELLHILRHSLGLDDKGRGCAYRNHFATGPDGDDFKLCQELVSLGYMKDRGTQCMWGGMHAFAVTEEGYKAEEQFRPVEKLTRSQRRYRSWLKADCGMSFGEWLKREEAIKEKV